MVTPPVRRRVSIERYTNASILPPGDVAWPGELFGGNNQREAVRDVERRQHFESSARRRQVAHGAVNDAPAETDGPRLKNPAAPCDSVFFSQRKKLHRYIGGFGASINQASLYLLPIARSHDGAHGRSRCQQI